MNAKNDSTTYGWFARSLFWLGQTILATVVLFILVGVATGGGSTADRTFAVAVPIVSASLLFRQVSKLVDDKLQNPAVESPGNHEHR